MVTIHDSVADSAIAIYRQFSLQLVNFIIDSKVNNILVKMTSFFTTVPLDLIKELSCYMNYQTTTILLQFCDISADTVWKYKIVHELNYYQSDSDVLNFATVLPLDQKYLELKSITSTDIGCEIFINDLMEAYRKAVLVKDSYMRHELLEYLQSLPIIQTAEDCMLCEMSILKGALEADNKDLIDEYKHYLELDEKMLQQYMNTDYYDLPDKIKNYGKMAVLLIIAAHINEHKDMVKKYNKIMFTNKLINAEEARKSMGCLDDWGLAYSCFCKI